MLTHPWTLPGGPGPLAPSPLLFCPRTLTSTNPPAAGPGRSCPRPIGRPGSICPYLARPLQAASTPSPAQAGLSLSLRLFEVWLWGPGGHRFKRTFWLSHFLTAPVLGAAAAAAAQVAPSLRGPSLRGLQPSWPPPPPDCLNGLRGKELGRPITAGFCRPLGYPFRHLCCPHPQAWGLGSLP